jgi:D-amino-acid dehydrogenase
MKVIVLGGGVIGVTSAYYLAKAGHEVEVIERQPGVALETSFANAGEISPGYASPWAAPGIPRKAIKWLLMKHPPLIVKAVADPYMARWILQMLTNCTAGRYATNKARMVRVAEYSRDLLKALRAETGITYDERMQGTLQLFRTQHQVDGAKKDIAVLAEYGVAYELLDRAGCIAAEPGLGASPASITGGLRLPGDETGDCHIFTTKLAALAVELGVVFRNGVTIEAVSTEGGKVTSVSTSAGPVSGDAYVLALGSYSPRLARTLGIDLPIYPVKGYSITAPIVGEATAPVSTVLDESYKIAITRLGDRIRVGGMAELSGYNSELSPKRRETLAFCVNELFPGAGDTAKASFWTGMRPMTPDSTPIIGLSKLANLYINSGHGTLGWTMACGSARVIADMVSGKPADIDISDLGPKRYR